MIQRHASSPRETVTLTTDQLREQFLIEQLFVEGQIELVYSHYDRMIVGGAVPAGQTLTLPNPANLKANYFLERRELGILNVGGAGQVTVDGTSYELGNQDCLYVGKGRKPLCSAARRPATICSPRQPTPRTQPRCARKPKLLR
ncbi:hypothetical protein [Hymenobacter qilianensis]|uniref:hypothetical protein n=1 Tax=Hymenobacter qilianensis TaxID=1385715 RepID=UPI00293BE14D|nr:hypothetical protein [Hymenobacter qilianensis]